MTEAALRDALRGALLVVLALALPARAARADEDTPARVAVWLTGCETAPSADFARLVQAELGTVALEVVALLASNRPAWRAEGVLSIEIDGCADGEGAWLTLAEDPPIRQRVPLRLGDPAYGARALAAAIGSAARAWLAHHDDRVEPAVTEAPDAPALEGAHEVASSTVLAGGGGDAAPAPSEPTMHVAPARDVELAVTLGAGALVSVPIPTAHGALALGAALDLPRASLRVALHLVALATSSVANDGTVDLWSVGGALDVGARTRLDAIVNVAALVRATLLSVHVVGTPFGAGRAGTTSSGLAMTLGAVGHVSLSLGAVRPWLEIEAAVAPLGVQALAPAPVASLELFVVAARAGLEVPL